MENVRFIRNVKLGVKSLLLHKLRSFLTMLGVVFGVGSVVAMLSVGEGASQEAQNLIKRLGSTNVILSSSKPPSNENQNSTSRSMLLEYGLRYDDLQRIHEGFAEVEMAVPAKIVNKTAKLGGREQVVRVVGTTPDWFKVVERVPLAGRILKESDVTTVAPVVVLAEEAARKLLPNHHTIGQHVVIDGNAFEVVGIIRNGHIADEGGETTPDSRVDAYVPLSVARERFGDMDVQRQSGSFSAERVELHKIIVRVGDTQNRIAIDNVERAANGIEAMLQHFHRTEDYKKNVPKAKLQAARESARIFNIVLGSIAGISLLVGGIGIMNIMLASVTERTREIGIRRAIGARKSQIIGQFLIETIVLSITGGIIGVGVGVFLPFLIEYFFKMPTVVVASSVILSLTVSAGIGIVFGIYPAYRAANLDPIIALRHE